MPARPSMELVCSVRLEYPGHPISSRKVRSTISAYVSPEIGNELWIKPSNKPEVRKLKWAKVAKMFVLSLNEGKSTIRFADPLLDVIIADADPRDLASFLRLLSGKPVKIHTISPPSLALGVMKIKTLTDLRRDVTDPKLINVPSIEATNLKLTAIYPQMLNRPRLLKLNVSDNRIRRLPFYAWHKLESLAYLNLSNNRIVRLPGEMFVTTLRYTLQTLDISSNHLTFVPSQVFHMRALTLLNISNNSISELPESFGSNPKLSSLYMVENPMTVLPAILLKMRLVNLHYGRSATRKSSLENALDDDGSIPPIKIIRSVVPTLKDLASQRVLQLNRSIGCPDLPMDVVLHLGRARPCFVCHRLHYSSYLEAVRSEPELRFVRTVKVESLTTKQIAGTSRVPVKYNVCSDACVKLFSLPTI